MPRTRPPYSPELRRQMVDLVRVGRDPEDLAKEVEPTAQSIRFRVAVADRQEGRRPDNAMCESFSLRWNANCSTAAASHLKPRRGWRASALLRVGTTPSDCIRRWATDRR